MVQLEGKGYCLCGQGWLFLQGGHLSTGLKMKGNEPYNYLKNILDGGNNK
jgi:hypothetical protein